MHVYYISITNIIKFLFEINNAPTDDVFLITSENFKSLLPFLWYAIQLLF